MSSGLIVVLCVLDPSRQLPLYILTHTDPGVCCGERLSVGEGVMIVCLLTTQNDTHVVQTLSIGSSFSPTRLGRSPSNAMSTD